MVNCYYEGFYKDVRKCQLKCCWISFLGGVWREGSSNANGERFKEDDDKAMLKGPYEI